MESYYLKLNDSLNNKLTWKPLGSVTANTALEIPSTAKEILAVFSNSVSEYRTTVLIPTSVLDTTARPFTTGFYTRADVYVTAYVSAKTDRVGWFRYTEQSGSVSYTQASSSVGCYCYYR